MYAQKGIHCNTCNFLAHNGFSNVQFYHLSKARKLIVDSDNSDIVVFDLRLSDSNGIDLLRWMHKEGKM